MSQNKVRQMIERTAQRAKSVSNARNLVARFGDVQTYDPIQNMVTVSIQNNFDNNGLLGPTEYGPMPILAPMSGNGYGMQVGIEVGQQVLIMQMEESGDQYVAIALARTENSPTRNQHIQAGEFEVASKPGTIVKLDANGNAMIGTGINSAPTTLSNNTLLGNLASIVAGNPNGVVRYKDIAILITALNSHQHSGVASGMGFSGPPKSPFSNPGASGTVKAGD